MRQFVEIAVFWVVVFVAICVLARFPDSWPGRILFARQPRRIRSARTEACGLLRWALFAVELLFQVLLVLGMGWEAIRLDSWLSGLLFFQVFWMVVVPLLAAVALLVSLLALTASLWRRYVGAERRKRDTSHAVRA
jgi:hypothetical protein